MYKRQCGRNTESTQNKNQVGEEQEVVKDTVESENAIIAYFSWSGNTEAVAQEIQSQTGADIFKINPQKPYTDDYDTLLDMAQEEQANDVRPAIDGTIENFNDYDTVYIGYPNWWGDMPMILYTFFDDYDLSGKTIIPFVTSGGSGFSSTENTIKTLEPNAVVLEGLSVSSDDANNASSSIQNWLSHLGLIEE